MTLHDELRAMLAKARRYAQSATALRDQGDYEFQTTAGMDDVNALVSKAQDFIAATEDFLKAKHHLS